MNNNSINTNISNINLLFLIDNIINKLLLEADDDTILRASKTVLKLNKNILPTQINKLNRDIEILKEAIRLEVIYNRTLEESSNAIESEVDSIIEILSKKMHPILDAKHKLNTLRQKYPNEHTEVSEKVQEAMNIPLEENLKLLQQYNKELTNANAKQQTLKESIRLFNEFADKHSLRKRNLLEDAEFLIMKLELVKKYLKSDQKSDSLLQIEIGQTMGLSDIDEIKKLDSNLHKEIKDLTIDGGIARIKQLRNWVKEEKTLSKLMDIKEPNPPVGFFEAMIGNQDRIQGILEENIRLLDIQRSLIPDNDDTKERKEVAEMMKSINLMRNYIRIKMSTQNSANLNNASNIVNLQGVGASSNLNNDDRSSPPPPSKKRKIEDEDKDKGPRK